MNGAYRFRTAAHWRAGASLGFAEVGDALEAQVPLALERDGRVPAGALVADAGCGTLLLLDGTSGRLRALSARGAMEEGRLKGLSAPRALVADGRWLWVAQAGSLLRYDAASHQSLAAIPLPGLASIAGDGCCGLWTAALRDDVAVVGHVDRWGVTARDCDLAVPSREPPLVAGGGDGRWLALLTGDGGGAWRLTLFAADGEAPAGFALPPRERPCALAIQGEDILLLTVAGRLMRFERDGVLAGEEAFVLPDGEDATALVLIGDRIGLLTSGGLLMVVPAPGDAEVDRRASFVTPTLVSPPGVPSGWRRADIDISLPEGASMTVRVAGSASAAAVAAMETALALPALDRFATVDALAPWRGGERSYAGTGKSESARRTFFFLLDEVPEPNLWLRIELVTPTGAAPAVLHGLTVRYPDRSWLDNLPAIYRDDHARAVELRRFLAPLEQVFEDFDTLIAAGPRHLDPATAPDERLDALLAWLGFPAMDGIAAELKRALLTRASDLLVRRGTLDALREALAIVTRNRAEVTDSAAGPFLWALGGKGLLAARLGRDTRVVDALPSYLRLGCIPLGGRQLGRPDCVDVDALMAATCAVLTVRIAVPAAERAVLAPVIDALLAMFVPAHCPIELRYVPPGNLTPPGLLDVDASVDAETGDNLGETSRAGIWRLPGLDPPPLSLDPTALLGTERRLA